MEFIFPTYGVPGTSTWPELSEDEFTDIAYGPPLATAREENSRD